MIIVLTSGHLQQDDGRVYQRCTRSLVNAGYKVTQIGPYGKNFLKKDGDLIIIGFEPRKDYNLRYRWKPLFEILKILRKNPAEVYHCHELDVLLIALVIKFFKRTKVIYDCHELTARIFAINHFPKFMHNLMEFLVFRIEYILFRLSDGLSAPAEPVIRQFAKKPEKNVILTPNVPSREQTRIVKRPEDCDKFLDKQAEITGIFIGVIHKRRGILEMISALKILMDRGISNLNLVIIGDCDTSFYDKMISMIKDNHLSEKVIYKKRVPYQEMWTQMQQADFGFVLDPPIPENLNVLASKFYEYLSAGLPIFVSDLPLNHETVEKHRVGILSPPDDERKIADSLEKMIKLIREEGYDLNLKCRKTFEENFCWEKYEPELLKLYKSIVERNH